jgi:hypothetical protein
MHLSRILSFFAANKVYFGWFIVPRGYMSQYLSYDHEQAHLVIEGFLVGESVPLRRPTFLIPIQHLSSHSSTLG